MLANTQNFEVTTSKEDDKCKIILYLFVFQHHSKVNPPEFSITWFGLDKYQPRKIDYLWTISDVLETDVFK